MQCSSRPRFAEALRLAAALFLSVLLFACGSPGGSDADKASAPPAPKVSPAAGGYASAQYVALAARSDERIRYTTDGSVPDESTGTLYTEPIWVPVSTTVKAVAYRDGSAAGPVVEAAYEIGPRASAAGGALAVSLADFHGLALRWDGTVWAWGSNSAGQLGDGSAIEGWGKHDHAAPVRVFGLTDVVAIEAAGSNSYAVKRDGSLWAWGSGSGLGTGEAGWAASRSVPVRVPGLTDVVAVSAGSSGHVAALRRDGTVWTWGRNERGELGDGTRAHRRTPARVEGLTDVVAVSAGSCFTLAATRDGTVWGWGDGSCGQLGVLGGADVVLSPEVQCRLTPAPIGGISGAVAVAAGERHSVARDAEGRVWTWGDGVYGALGDGTFGQRRSKPAPVSGLPRIAVLHAGYLETMVLAEDGTLWAWGSTAEVGPPEYGVATPRPIAGPGGPAGFEALGVLAAADYGCVCWTVLKADGTLWSWGDNESGRLGDGTTTDRETPVQVLPLAGEFTPEALPAPVASPPSGSYTGRQIATLWATPGVSIRYTLDGSSPSDTEGTLYTREAPIRVPFSATLQAVAYQEGSTTSPISEAAYEIAPIPAGSLASAVAVVAGGSHTLALDDGGTVWVWGRWDAVPWPLPVLGDAAKAVSPNYSIEETSYVIRRDGTLWKLQGPDLSTPTRVPGVGDVIAVAAGPEHAVALQGDGTVWTWGRNSLGQLGDGTTEDRVEPVRVPGLSNVVAVSVAERLSTYALKADGTVWAWGGNGCGQLGDGTQVERHAPVQVTGLSGVVALATHGRRSAYALRGDGTVWGWGCNTWGELGDGTLTNRSTPVQALGVGDVVALTDRGGRVFALQRDGTLWRWGGSYARLLEVPTQAIPGPVPGLGGVVSVRAGPSSNYALTSDGALWFWEEPRDEDDSRVLTPVRLSGSPGYEDLQGLVSFEVGEAQVALRDDGTVWAWGKGAGDGTAIERPFPMQVLLLPSDR